jgi:hypothetical protein
MAEEIEALAEEAEKAVEHSPLFVLMCPCLRGRKEARARAARREALVIGATFRRKAFTMMRLIASGGATSEEVFVQLSPSGTPLTWRSPTKASSHGEISMFEVRTLGAKGDASLTLTSRSGDVLLELEADDAITRDFWVSALKEVRRARGRRRVAWRINKVYGTGRVGATWRLRRVMCPMLGVYLRRRGLGAGRRRKDEPRGGAHGHEARDAEGARGAAAALPAEGGRHREQEEGRERAQGALSQGVRRPEVHRDRDGEPRVLKSGAVVASVCLWIS